MVRLLVERVTCAESEHLQGAVPPGNPPGKAGGAASCRNPFLPCRGQLISQQKVRQAVPVAAPGNGE